MKTNILLCLALSLLLPSCSSRPKVDWNAVDWNGRIGHYTYDQALTELGKPSGVSESSEGRAAEWTIKRSSRMSLGLGMGVGTTVSPKPRGEFMRLQFGPDAILKRWERVRY